EVPAKRPAERTPRDLGSRGTEPSPSPPPLVQAQLSPPPAPPPRRRLPPRGVAPPVPPPEPTPLPPPPKRPKQFIPPKCEEYGILEYLKEDALHTTMTESMPLISKWFGRVGKVLKTVPGLQGVGKAYETIADIADGLELVYELVHELNQAEA